MASQSGISSHERPGGSLRRQFVRNLSHLASGKAVSAGLGLISLALAARLLGPAAFGIVAVIESYCRLIDQVLRVETWQAMIRYGTRPLLDGDRSRLARLMKLGVVIDVIGAVLVAGVAVAAVPLAARLFGWNDDARDLARLYAFALLFGASSTPVGILRLFGRFAQMAWVDPGLALARAIGLGAILILGGGLRSVVILFVTLVVAERLAMMILAWRAIRAAQVTGIARATLHGWREDFPDIVTFLASTNAAVLLRKATQESDTLAVGYLIGPVGAGVYQFARRVMQTVAKSAQMLQQVVAPDLARLWAAGQHERFARVVQRIEAATLGAMAVAIVALALGGRPMIAAVGGSGFAGAFAPMLAYAVAVALFLAGTTMRSALTVSGHAPAVLRSSIAATLTYLIVLMPAIRLFGVTGASVAQIAFSATALIMTSRSFRLVAGSSRPVSPLR